MKLPLLQEAKWENLCLIGPSVLTALDLPSQHRYHWSRPNLTVNQAQRCLSWPKHQFSFPSSTSSLHRGLLEYDLTMRRGFFQLSPMFSTYASLPSSSVLLFSSALYSTLVFLSPYFPLLSCYPLSPLQPFVKSLRRYRPPPVSKMFTFVPVLLLTLFLFLPLSEKTEKTPAN